MALNIQRVSIEDFEAFILSPENIEHDWELIDGEIVKVVSNSYSSEVAMLVGALITVFVRQHNLGRVTGADGGYVVGSDRYIPDVGFISHARQPQRPNTAYNPLPPDLAVEVISPTDDTAKIRIKLVNYTHAGTTLWLIDPEKQTVEVYAPDAPPLTLDRNGTLNGGTVLPGFSLPVKDIFPPQE